MFEISSVAVSRSRERKEPTSRGDRSCDSASEQRTWMDVPRVPCARRAGSGYFHGLLFLSIRTLMVINDVEREHADTRPLKTVYWEMGCVLLMCGLNPVYDHWESKEWFQLMVLQVALHKNIWQMHTVSSITLPFLFVFLFSLMLHSAHLVRASRAASWHKNIKHSSELLSVVQF